MNRDKDTWPCAGWQKATNGTFFYQSYYTQVSFTLIGMSYESKNNAHL